MLDPHLHVDPSAKLTLCGHDGDHYILSFIDSNAAADWFADAIIRGTDSQPLKTFMNELAGMIEFLPVEVDAIGVVELRNRSYC